LYSNFNSEYNHSFNTKFGLNVGFGNSYKKLDNFFYQNYDQPENKDVFTFSEIKNQLYTYLTYKPTEKLSFKFGLAAENAWFLYNNTKKPFTILAPHFDAKYKIGQVLDIKFLYRSGFNYPNISQLNPFTTIVDWQTISQGNPNLEPERVDKFSLKLNVLGGLISLEPYYNYSKSQIIEILTLQENNTWLNTFENAAVKKDKGFQAGFALPLGKYLFIQNFAKFFWESMSYNNETHKSNDWTMNCNLMYMNQKSNTLIGLFYQNQLRKVLTWQGYVTWGNDLWGLFFQQSFFKEKLNIMIIYSIPLDFGVEYNQGTFVKTNLYEEYTINDLSAIKNCFFLEISYRFTKGKDVKKMDKNVNIEKEIEQKSFF